MYERAESNSELCHVCLSVSHPLCLFCLSVLNNSDPTGQTLSSHTRENLFFVKCMLGQTKGMCGRFHIACYNTDESKTKFSVTLDYELTLPTLTSFLGPVLHVCYLMTVSVARVLWLVISE